MDHSAVVSMFIHLCACTRPRIQSKRAHALEAFLLPAVVIQYLIFYSYYKSLDRWPAVVTPIAHAAAPQHAGGQAQFLHLKHTSQEQGGGAEEAVRRQQRRGQQSMAAGVAAAVAPDGGQAAAGLGFKGAVTILADSLHTYCIFRGPGLYPVPPSLLLHANHAGAECSVDGRCCQLLNPRRRGLLRP